MDAWGVIGSAFRVDMCRILRFGFCSAGNIWNQENEDCEIQNYEGIESIRLISNVDYMILVNFILTLCLMNLI